MCSSGNRSPQAFRQHRRRSAGFSLLEVMVALVIIGLIAGLITANVRGRMLLARQNVARAEVRVLVDAVEQFHLIYNRYPTNDEGLAILTEKTSVTPEPLLSGKSLTDPWGRPYDYLIPGRNEPFEVISYGADGREGGQGADADVASWDPKPEAGHVSP